MIEVFLVEHPLGNFKTPDMDEVMDVVEDAVYDMDIGDQIFIELVEMTQEEFMED